MRTETTRRARDHRSTDAAELSEQDRETNAFLEILDGDAPVAGPLSDLSFAVKEIIEQKGCATPLGVPFLHDRIATANAPVLDQVLATGARRVGTTRSTLLAIVGDSGTRNPLDLGRSPGGSSAGSAAAVAAGMVDFALGTQSVGSIVRPASYCGVTGFKPTFDTLPTEGVMKLANELDHVGLIAKDSRTLRRVFRVLSGNDGARGRLSKAVFPVSWFENPVHPSVENARERLGQMLEESGTALSRGALPDAVTSVEAQTLQALVAKGVFDNHRAFIEAHEAALPEDLLTLAKAGERLSAQDHDQLRQTQRHLRDVMDRLIDDETFIVVPSVVDMPPMLGSGTGLRDPQRLWTLLGWPAVSIPFGSYDGDHGHLSTGLQLVAKPGLDHLLLQLAEDIERRKCTPS